MKQELGLGLYSITNCTGNILWCFTKIIYQAGIDCTSNHHADWSIHCGDVKWPSWRPEILAYRVFVQRLFQTDSKNIKGPRYCSFVRRTTLTCGFPAQRESNTEDLSIWWRHNWSKAIIIWDNYSSLGYDGTCIILRNMHIALQPLNKKWFIEVGMSSSRWFLCYRWVHFLRTITLSVKNCKTATGYLPPAECGGWAHKVRKGLPKKNLQGKHLKFSSDLPNLACPLGGSVDGAY